jgi:hypothetical protein
MGHKLSMEFAEHRSQPGSNHDGVDDIVVVGAESGSGLDMTRTNEGQSQLAKSRSIIMVVDERNRDQRPRDEFQATIEWPGRKQGNTIDG